MKKTLDTTGITNELTGRSAFFRNDQTKPTGRDESLTHVRDNPREVLRDNPREMQREDGKDWPTRDEIQEFSFRLRDELRVKLQAEVPHLWQQELDELARELRVGKLELYRYIIGLFLGKVERKAKDSQRGYKQPF